MTPFNSVLVATDFSVDGDNAVRRAARVAHEHGARLHILHVLEAASRQPLRDWFFPAIDVDREAAQARSALRQLAVEIAGTCDLAPSVELATGDPFEALMRASERADLVVLGSRGCGRPAGLRIGTSVDRVLRRCRRPVLVVKTAVAQPYRRVLLPIDFTASSDAAIRVAARMQREADLHVLHALDSRRESVLRDADVPEHIIRETRLMEEDGTKARMRRKLAGLGLDGMHIHCALTHGCVVRSTLRHAQAIGADLIVTGRQRRSTAAEFLLGSVSRRILCESACDTLIVPGAPDAAAPHAAAAPVGASASVPWIHNTARFMPRRPS